MRFSSRFRLGNEGLKSLKNKHSNWKRHALLTSKTPERDKAPVRQSRMAQLLARNRTSGALRFHAS